MNNESTSRLPATHAAKVKCVCGHEAHDGERCRHAISVLPMRQCKCMFSVAHAEEGEEAKPNILAPNEARTSGNMEKGKYQLKVISTEEVVGTFISKYDADDARFHGQRAPGEYVIVELPMTPLARSTETREKHDFVGDFAYGVCDKCGREKSDYQYHSVTPEPAKPSESFWVIEQFEDGKSKGYWFANGTRDFTSDINNAVQFRRRSDASMVSLSWHWKDCIVTEHRYLLPEPAKETEAEPEWLDQPNEQGYWWHSRGDSEARPFIFHVQISMTGTPRYFIDYPNSNWCDEVGGKWMKVAEPKAWNAAKGVSR